MGSHNDLLARDYVGEMRSTGQEFGGTWLPRGVLGCEGDGTIRRVGGIMEQVNVL